MITISEVMAVASQSYQAGQLSQAESICRQILQQQSDCLEALHLLGIMAHQVGKLQEAVSYYEQILALKPDRAETYYSLGAALHALGQIEAATSNYQQAVALKPDYTDALYDLGTAFQEQGDLSAAIEHYQKVVALNPDDPEAHGNLANALLEQGETEAAIAHYQEVIALKPGVPGIYYNLGNALRQQSQLETAISYYKWALVLDPNYLDAYVQIGATLHQQHLFEQAIAYYQQAIALKPNPDAYYYLGNTLLQQGRYSEASISYQHTIALDPEYLNAYLEQGRALIHDAQLEKATACLQQAVNLKPDSPEAHQNLGIALVNQNKVEEAIGCFQKALQLKPDFAEAYWQNQLIMPILYDAREQIPVWRQHFCRGVNHLIQQTDFDTSDGRNQGMTALDKCIVAFYLSYQGFNERGLQRKLGQFTQQVMATHYPQWASPLPVPHLSTTDKIRVGYLSAHFREHTVAKLTLGWFKNFDKQQFEVYIYYVGHQVDATTQEFRACSDRFHHIYINVEAICQQVIDDKLHILVFTDIGMQIETTKIAGLRLAPVQCMTWGHPVTSGLPTVDYFLSGDLMEPENARQHYTEKLVRLPNIGMCYEKPSVPAQTKTRSDFQLRDDAIIYLSCQSLFKYLPQFDYIFAEIARQVPQAQFVFLSHHTIAITTQFQARLRHAFAELGLNSEDYCVLLPRQERVDYFNLNLVSDIFLDTLNWSGGNTTLEAIACGLPVVTRPGEFMRGRHSYGILRMMGVTETIAHSEAEYVEIAVRLGLDADWRQEIANKIYERHSWLYNDKTCVSALESFYKKVLSV